MTTSKRTIAIVCGGDSSEHDVSLRSAQGLYSFFDKERYNVYIVDFNRLDWRVNLPDGTLRRFHNPKFPEQYIEMIDSVCKQKEELFALM